MVLAVENARLVLFLLGIVISILGWLVDKAVHLPRILKVIAPRLYYAKEALEILDADETAILALDHRGTSTLLRWWQPRPTGEVLQELSGIGRSTGIFNIPTGIHRYELRLLVNNNSDMAADFVWCSNEAKKRLDGTLQRMLLRWGWWVFFGGITLSVSMMVWEWSDT